MVHDSVIFSAFQRRHIIKHLGLKETTQHHHPHSTARPADQRQMPFEKGRGRVLYEGLAANSSSTLSSKCVLELGDVGQSSPFQKRFIADSHQARYTMLFVLLCLAAMLAAIMPSGRSMRPQSLVASVA
eukprot:GFKZ01014614.1.p2 GENE.GFKZ01014614.1~~GFKZ01014614.1.p2  ORF type:complete len:129 (+),score=4.85 GFKZ01014614.1:568-954(+)